MNNFGWSLTVGVVIGVFVGFMAGMLTWGVPYKHTSSSLVGLQITATELGYGTFGPHNTWDWTVEQKSKLLQAREARKQKLSRLNIIPAPVVTAEIDDPRS